MTPIVSKIEIAGPPEEVFSYVTDPSRFPEWQRPPSRWAVRGVDGPIRALVDVTVEPLSESARSRVTIEVDFEGHGIGKLLVPLVVRRQAANEMPKNLQTLKERI